MQEKTYYTIAEVVNYIGVPAHTLRFWEKKFYNLRPVKIRNRRYYRYKDLELLKQIKLQQNQGEKHHVQQDLMLQSSNHDIIVTIDKLINKLKAAQQELAI